MLLWVLLVSVVALWTTNVHATTFHVDAFNVQGVGCNGANNGAINSPVCTIAQGRALLNAAGQGHTLYIRAGTYSTGIVVDENTPMPSGVDADHPTVVAGFPGEVVVLQGGISTHWYWPATGVLRYTVFKNFVLDGGALNILGCYYITDVNNIDMNCGPHFVKFEDLEVKNVQPGSGVGDGYGASHLTYTRLHVHHNGNFGDPNQGRLDHGFYVNASDTVYEYINAHDNSGYGFQLYEGAPQCWPQCHKNVIVRNSYFHNNHLSTGEGEVTLQHGENLQFYNNVVYAVPSGGRSTHGGVGLGRGTSHARIWNNTVYATNPGAKLEAGHPTDFTLSDIVLQNNIVYGAGATIVLNQVTSWTANKNLCSDINSYCEFNGNPAFANASNPSSGCPATDLSCGFKLLSNSAARNQGITIPTVNIDKAGAARPQGTPPVQDIGAYEFDEGGVIPPPPTGNPIYVAATGGTPTTDCITAEAQATPIRTIAAALPCMVIPGKRMIIKAGTYVERIDTQNTAIVGGNGPSFTNATTIETFGTDAVTIQLPVTDQPILFLRNGTNDKYLLFKGSSTNKLVFDGNNLANSNGIACYASAHHIRFEQVEVKNTNFEAIYNLGCNNFEMVDSYVHHSNASAGIAIDGTTSDMLIQRTAIYNNATRGINLIGSSTVNLTIRESVLHHNVDGIFVGASTNFTLVNSILQENTGKGIQIATGAGSPKLQNNTVYANTGVGVQCDAGATSVQVTNVMSYGNGTNLLNNCTMTQQTNRTGTSNPFFVNAPSDLRLTPNLSDGINAGTNIPSLTTDYAGLPRQQDQQDIGAHETTQTVIGGDTTVMKPSRRNRSMFFDVATQPCIASQWSKWHTSCNILP